MKFSCIVSQRVAAVVSRQQQRCELQRHCCCSIASDNVAIVATLVRSTSVRLSSDSRRTIRSSPVVLRPLPSCVLLLPRRCCYNNGAAVLRRCCCSDGTVVLLLQRWRCGATVLRCCDVAATMMALRLKFLFFFLLDNFRRENESEKEKKERDSKPISRLYWLA